MQGTITLNSCVIDYIPTTSSYYTTGMAQFKNKLICQRFSKILDTLSNGISLTNGVQILRQVSWPLTVSTLCSILLTTSLLTWVAGFGKADKCHQVRQHWKSVQSPVWAQH